MASKKQTAWKVPPSYHFLTLLLKIQQQCVNWSHCNFPTLNILSSNKPLHTCSKHFRTNKGPSGHVKNLGKSRKINEVRDDFTRSSSQTACLLCKLSVTPSFLVSLVSLPSSSMNFANWLKTIKPTRTRTLGPWTRKLSMM